MDISSFIDSYGHAVKEWLESVIKADDNTLLKESMAYTLLSSGKMLRPILLGLVCDAYGGDLNSSVIPAGCVEMIHSYSLIHDDLPCMDNDDTRRGVPSNHIVYNETISLLAGDALLTQAFECLSSKEMRDTFEGDVIVRLVNELSTAAGASGMILGQVLDMCGKTDDAADIIEMQLLKTGKLITAACRMGAIIAGVSDAELVEITEYANNLGLLFQITDDILDAKGDSTIVGKTLNKDCEQGKKNFVTVHGIAHAEEIAEGYAKAAISNIGNKKELSLLVEMIEMIKHRDR